MNLQEKEKQKRKTETPLLCNVWRKLICTKITKKRKKKKFC